MSLSFAARPYHSAVVSAAYTIASTLSGVTFRGGMTYRLPSQQEFNASLAPGQPNGYYLAILQPQPIPARPDRREQSLWESWRELRIYAIGAPAGPAAADPTALAALQDTCDLLEQAFIQYDDISGTCESDTILTNVGGGILNPADLALRWYAAQLRIQYHLILPLSP